MTKNEEIVNNNIKEQLNKEIKGLYRECLYSELDYCGKVIASNNSDLILGLGTILPTVIVAIGCCVNMGLSKETTVDVVNMFLAPSMLTCAGSATISYYISNVYLKLKTGLSRSEIKDYLDAYLIEAFRKHNELTDKEEQLEKYNKSLVLKKES